MDVTYSSKFDQAKEWLLSRPPAIEHQQGSLVTIDTIRTLVNGFDLSPNEAFEIAQNWNETCQPPWSDKDLLRKCDEAAKMSYDKPPGFLIKGKKRATSKNIKKQNSKQKSPNVTQSKKEKFKPHNRGGNFKNSAEIMNEWIAYKKGISLDALQQTGAETGIYQDKNVILFRIFAPQDTETQCGDAVYNADGSNVTIKGSESKKVKMTSHSTSGIVGKYAINALDKGEHKNIIKAAGIPDHLAIQSKLIEAGLCNEYLSFTNSCGETESPEKYVPLLEKSLDQNDYYVIADNDDAGKKSAQKWAKAGWNCGAKTRIVTLPTEINEIPIKDVRDFFVAGKSLDDLFEIFRNSPIVTENDFEDFQYDKKNILEEIGIIVFGLDNQTRITIYSDVTKRIYVIDDISKFTYEQLILIAGRDILKKVIPSNTPNPDFSSHNPTMAEVRREIAAQASEINVQSDERHGQGVYLTKNGTVVIVNGEGTATAITENESFYIQKPFFEEMYLNLNCITKLYDNEKIIKMHNIYNPKQSYDSFMRLCDLICQWNFGSINGIDKSDTVLLLAGLAYATILQSIWQWRPLIYIGGQSGAGKSKFLNLLEYFFGNASLRRSKPTEAALRQEISDKSCVILIDELENDRNRKHLLEYLRTSGDGSIISRGTRRGDAQLFGLKHIVWLASIELNLEMKADANRFIVFELEPPIPSKRKTLSIPKDELFDLGFNAFTFMCINSAGFKLLNRSKELAALTFGQHEARTIECYSIPAAIIEKVMQCGGVEFDAVEFLERILNQTKTINETTLNDHERLLEDILNSKTQILNQGNLSISQIISLRQMTSDEYDRALESVGIIMRFIHADSSIDKAGYIGFCPNAVKQNITRFLPQWNEMNIGDILRRHPQAAKFDNRFRIKGIQKRAIWIPFNTIVDTSDNDIETIDEIPLELPLEF